MTTDTESNARLNGVKKSSNCINIQVNQHDVSPLEESYSSGDFLTMEHATAKMMQAHSLSINELLCNPPPLHGSSDDNVFAFESGEDGWILSNVLKSIHLSSLHPLFLEGSREVGLWTPSPLGSSKINHHYTFWHDLLGLWLPPNHLALGLTLSLLLVGFI